MFDGQYKTYDLMFDGQYETYDLMFDSQYHSYDLIFGDHYEIYDLMFGGQYETYDLMFGGQYETYDLTFGGQYETYDLTFGGQYETYDLIFGDHYETYDLMFGGQYETYDLTFGGQYETYDLTFGGQYETYDLTFGRQYETYDLTFGGQYETYDLTFGGQYETYDLTFGGQYETYDLTFGGQYETYDLMFGGQYETYDLMFGGQYETYDLTFGGQYETYDLTFGGQYETYDLIFGDHYETYDLMFGGQYETYDLTFGGQYETYDLTFGGQYETYDLTFGRQYETYDLTFGGQYETYDLTFGGQYETYDLTFGGQYETYDLTFGGQYETYDLMFGGQYETYDLMFGGQYETYDLMFGGQYETYDLMFGGQYETYDLMFGGQYETYDLTFGESNYVKATAPWDRKKDDLEVYHPNKTSLLVQLSHRLALRAMDDMEGLLDTVVKGETQAAIHQKQNPWIPHTYGADISRSLQSLHSGGTQNPGYADDDLEYPYDKADPISTLQEYEDQDAASDTTNDGDEDAGVNEELRIPKMNAKGKLSSKDWNDALSLRVKKGRTILSVPEMLDNTPAADYEDDFEEETVFGGKTFNDTKTWSGHYSKLSPRTRRAQDKKTSSAGIEMTPPSKRKNMYVSFQTRRPQATTDSSVQEHDSLNMPDLAKLSELTLDTITDCVERRYKQDLIYTWCGEILISSNPFKSLDLCTYKYFDDYTESKISNIPHLYAVSARAYQGVRRLQQNQVILVSGESGAGKTEATKLIVRHLMYIAGSDYETLQDRIIQINPLLEAFGNARTKLNRNSSRFAKFLTLYVNIDGKIESARVKDYMLEKSRVVHHGPGERTFHSFYSFLVGASDVVLRSFDINREDVFRVTGNHNFNTGAEKNLYKTFFDLMQDGFKLIKLTEDEIHDVYTVLAAILHLGNVEFEESDNDSVIIKNEDVVGKVASLLQLDVEQLTKVLIERTGRLGMDQKTLYEIRSPKSRISQDSTSLLKTPSRGNKLDNEMFGVSWDRSKDDSNYPVTGDIIELSKNKKQADDERDATAKSLYERLFGWLVRKINDSLRSFRNPASIGILDICGFEDLEVNSFEQLCINLVNEQLQNFMNKTVIEDERVLYLQEGVEIGDVDIESINNDPILRMFMEKRTGILAIIDEDSKLEISNDAILVSKLSKIFGKGGIFIPSVHNTQDFKIRHFAGEVAYDARSFIQKNRDTLSESMKGCFQTSGSIFIQDLFSVQESDTGSISMANYLFRGSKKPTTKNPKQFTEGNLSQSINTSRKASLQQKFGNKNPSFQTGDIAQRSTHIKFFRNSMDELLSTMGGAHPYFVRCIKPNDRQTPGAFSRDRVKTQLQYNGVKEIARIRTFGFPIRLSKAKFRKIYGGLADVNSKSDLFLDILQVANADPRDYKVGQTQIFMKEPVKATLDSALETLRQQEEEERMRMEEEMRVKEMRRRKEKIEQEKQQRTLQLKEELDVHIELSVPPLETIAETSTPGSCQDDYPYNKTTVSSGSDIRTTEESDDDSSEEETSENTLFEEPKEEVPAPAWDVTQELTEEEERNDVHEQPVLMVIKSIVYILLFLVCLGSFVFQKVGLLFLTTNLKYKTEQLTSTKANVQPVIFLFLVIALCIPYALCWLFALAKICFGNFKKPSVSTWLWVFIMESFHSVGLCVLVFRVLPNLDIIRSAMLLNATAILPSVLKFVMSSSDFETTGGCCVQCNLQGLGVRILRHFLDFFMMLFQISVIPLIIVMDYFKEESGNYNFSTGSYYILETVAAFLLVSCAHWENFTDGRLFCELGNKNWFKNTVLKIRFDLQKGRHYPHLLTFLWKIGLTILMGYYFNKADGFSYEDAFAAFTIRKKPIQAQAIAAAIALMVSGFVAFFASFGACVFQMQVFSLTIPAVIAMPVTIGILYLNCHFNFLDFLYDVSDQESICLGMSSALNVEKYWYHFLFGFAWWLSLVVLSRHMWIPKLDRAANIARLFVNPSYCAILTSESIMLNRIRNPSKVREYPEVSDTGDIKVIYYKLGGKLVDHDDDVEDDESDSSNKNVIEENPATPMLYACATMWHETRTEMVQLLKSLHRLDRDQYIRRLVNERLQINENVRVFDPEFYNFEAHIFFDDAMEPDDNDEQVINKWVKELVSSMDVACSSVHGKPMKVHPPMKVPTPYGGQLIWQMPGENLLFVHMKDITKIRNRKRWSQVMYMHYLLGYRHIMMSKREVLEKMENMNAKHGYHGLNINEINYLLGEESAVKAQNTFLLALDGDTDFSPGSIKILLDRMKDEKVGAACGRIHPIGNGPMIWYQKFEYAIGHWLQKAAEHVFGCVLCSPGCFSLFRASALLDTNVMKRYTTEPTEPSHHLQYDQGEDRWLCTLLLQQGYRIEYAAAADAWTFAPEGFFEFFNQRRRWMPSTIANILDLLNSASLTTKRNANMSILYIGYQWLLMLMTILGPGTIIMMIAGAVKLVFKFTLVEAYIFSTVPAIVFTIVCFWFKSRIQLILAAILSILYTFIMMIVLVGTIITATTEDILHPSVIVIVMLIGIFVIAGLCHPQEIWCLVHGVMYLLTIPSGYLLLVIYSICNLNDVSWGTREVPTKAQRLELERKKKEKEELEKSKPKRSFFAKIFNSGEEHIRELTKLLKTIMPQKSASPQEQLGLNLPVATEIKEEEGKTVIELLMKIENNLKQLLNKKKNGEEDFDQLSSVVVNQPSMIKKAPLASAKPSTSGMSTRPKQLPSEVVVVVPEPQEGKRKKRKKRRDELKNPLWAEDKGLGNGVTIVGNAQELKFWAEFVEKYLQPIRPSEEEKKKIADGLRDLRNSSTFAMIIVNLLWMSLNFMFQLTNAARFTIRYGPNGNRKIEESVLGMGFVFLLLILLILQMFGMFIHRIGTLQHLLAITQIRICKAQEGNTSDDQRDREDAIRHIKEVLKIPMTGDVGAVTLPPTLADPNVNNWGMTVLKPSAKGTLGQEHSNSTLIQYLGQTMSHPTFAVGRSTKLLDPRTQETLNNVKQRLMAGSVIQKLKEHDEFGKSFRPRLPPRGRSFHQPMMMQATNFGFTQRELDKANFPVQSNFNETSELNQMGAMGRSLYVRSKVITETTDQIKRNSSLWSVNDGPLMKKKYSLNAELNHL